MSDCCHGGVPTGEDMKFFDRLSSVLEELSNRPADKILMDLTVGTKKSVYGRLLLQAKRLEDLEG